MANRSRLTPNGQFLDPGQTYIYKHETGQSIDPNGPEEVFDATDARSWQPDPQIIDPDDWEWDTSRIRSIIMLSIMILGVLFVGYAVFVGAGQLWDYMESQHEGNVAALAEKNRQIERRNEQLREGGSTLQYPLLEIPSRGSLTRAYLITALPHIILMMMATGAFLILALRLFNALFPWIYSYEYPRRYRVKQTRLNGIHSSFNAMDPPWAAWKRTFQLCPRNNVTLTCIYPGFRFDAIYIPDEVNVQRHANQYEFTTRRLIWEDSLGFFRSISPRETQPHEIRMQDVGINHADMRQQTFDIMSEAEKNVRMGTMASSSFQTERQASGRGVISISHRPEHMLPR